MGRERPRRALTLETDQSRHQGCGAEQTRPEGAAPPVGGQGPVDKPLQPSEFPSQGININSSSIERLIVRRRMPDTGQRVKIPSPTWTNEARPRHVPESHDVPSPEVTLLSRN